MPHSPYILAGENYEIVGNCRRSQAYLYQSAHEECFKIFLYSIGDHFENVLWLHSLDSIHMHHQKIKNIVRGGGILDIVSKLLLLLVKICRKRG